MLQVVRRRVEVREVESDSDSDPEAPEDVPARARRSSRAASASSLFHVKPSASNATLRTSLPTTASQPQVVKAKSFSQSKISRTKSSIPKTAHAFEQAVRSCKGKSLALAALLFSVPVKAFPKLMVTAMEADLLHSIISAVEAFIQEPTWDGNANLILDVLEGLLTVPRVDLAIALLALSSRQTLASCLASFLLSWPSLRERMDQIALAFDVSLADASLADMD